MIYDIHNQSNRIHIYIQFLFKFTTTKIPINNTNIKYQNTYVSTCACTHKHTCTDTFTCRHTLSNNFVHTETNWTICFPKFYFHFQMFSKCYLAFALHRPNACKCLYPSISSFFTQLDTCTQCVPIFMYFLLPLFYRYYLSS